VISVSLDVIYCFLLVLMTALYHPIKAKAIFRWQIFVFIMSLRSAKQNCNRNTRWPTRGSVSFNYLSRHAVATKRKNIFKLEDIHFDNHSVVNSLM